MFVFGEVQEPIPETAHLVEDIVRSQIIELVRLSSPYPDSLLTRLQIVQARALANKRGSRFVSVEDLIFLIRHDRGKVNRLRTYLSWKDVRKHAKDSGGDGGGAAEVEALEEGDGTSLPSTFTVPHLPVF
jgi:transcription initiation protein SPT3